MFISVSSSDFWVIISLNTFLWVPRDTVDGDAQWPPPYPRSLFSSEMQKGEVSFLPL